VVAEMPTNPTKEAKTKPKAKKPKPKEETKPTEAKTTKTQPKNTKTAPIIKPTTWERFEKFGQRARPGRKLWLKEALERAKKEPIEIRGLTRAQIATLIAHVNKHNLTQEPKIAIKYHTGKGIAILAPTTTKHLKTA
jgi:hypothetical protein